jgi:hypothetical protein
VEFNSTQLNSAALIIKQKCGTVFSREKRIRRLGMNVIAEVITLKRIEGICMIVGHLVSNN